MTRIQPITDGNGTTIRYKVIAAPRDLTREYADQFPTRQRCNVVANHQPAACYATIARSSRGA